MFDFLVPLWCRLPLRELFHVPDTKKAPQCNAPQGFFLHGARDWSRTSTRYYPH